MATKSTIYNKYCLDTLSNVVEYLKHDVFCSIAL